MKFLLKNFILSFALLLPLLFSDLLQGDEGKARADQEAEGRIWGQKREALPLRGGEKFSLSLFFSGELARLVFENLYTGTRSLNLPNGIFRPGEEVACSSQMNDQEEIGYHCALHIDEKGFTNRLTTTTGTRGTRSTGVGARGGNLAPTSLAEEITGTLMIQSYDSLGLVKGTIEGPLAQSLFDLLQSIEADSQGRKLAGNLHCRQQSCEFLITNRGFLEAPREL